MADELYILLDALELNTINPGGQRPVLGKVVPKTEYMGKTVSDVVQKLLDPEPDQYNTREYNAQERTVAQRVSKWFTTMNQNPDELQLDVVAVSNDESRQEIPLHLTDKLSQYTNQIIQKTQETGSSGETLNVEMVELFAIPNTLFGGTIEDLCDYR